MFARNLSTLILWLACCSAAFPQDEATPSNEDTLIDFQRHVQPILTQRCLVCHGPEDAKNDFRVDDRDSILAYVEPGDSAASSLWTDYLNTSDTDMLMPPASEAAKGGLPLAELLILKTWIEEGADGTWTTDQANASPDLDDPDTLSAEPKSTLAKVWSFQGLFHPASVHLPIALLSVSALFVFFSFFNRASCEPVAYHCLWIGALGAIVACIAGWSYAVHEGYSGVGFNINNNAIDRHRWAGVFVATFAVLTIPLARRVRRFGRVDQRIIWLMASVVLALAVAITGYQGGELTFGEDHYWKYYNQLFGSPASATNEAADEAKPSNVDANTAQPSNESANAPALPATQSEPPPPTEENTAAPESADSAPDTSEAESTPDEGAFSEPSPPAEPPTDTTSDT